MGFDNGSGFNPDNVTLETNISGEAGVKDGGININQIGDLEKWEFLETVTFSGDTTKTSGSLAVHSKYKIVAELSAVTSNTNMTMRFNGDTGNNYFYVWLPNLVPTFTSNANSLVLGNISPAEIAFFEAIIGGKTKAVSSGQIQISTTGFGVTASSLGQIFSGIWIGGNAIQVSNMSFIGANALTGTINIYGVD